MSTGTATPPTSLLARTSQWIRALGIRILILFTALMLTVPTAELISTSSAFAQTRDPALASAQQALAAALPSLTLAPAGDAPTTPPDPTVPPDATPPPVPAPAASPTAIPTQAPVNAVSPAPTNAPTASAPAVAVVPSAPDVAAAQVPAAAEAPAPAVPAAPEPAQTTPSTSFPVSSAVKSLLAGLNISLPDGPVTGTLNGTTLTVGIDAPVLPIALPVGAHTLNFAGATLTIDEATKSLTLSGTATSDNGVTATLSVTIGNVSTTDLTGTGPTADLSATVTITGVPVLGTVVDLTGTLSYSGGKPAVSVAGKLAADAVVAPNTLTIKSGSTITLSSTDGFKIDGSAIAGSGASVFTVGVKGEVHDPKTWSLDVSIATDQSFSPIDGLTITPNFAGTITDTAGVVRFDLSSNNETGSWTTGPVTLALQHVEVSNAKPAAGQACSAIADGDVWFDVKGSLTDDALKLNADAEACVNASNKTVKITANAPNGLLPGSAGFSIDNAQLTVSRDTSGTVAVSATGTLNITAGLPAGTAPKPIAIAISFASDGSFVASGSVNLADLKLGTGTAAVYVASADVKNYAYGTKGDKIDLAQGVTLVLDAQPSTDVTRVFSYLKLPAPKTIRTVATLSANGFAGTVAATFGSGTSGAQLLGKSTPGGATLYLNSMSLGVNLSATNASISISGSAYLTLPPLYPGSTSGSAIQVSLTGALSLTPDSVAVSIGFNLDSPGGWTDAFGIPEMTVQQVAGTFGIKIGADTGGLPVPTLSFLVKDLQLPPALASAIGVTVNTKISLSLAMDVDQPIVHFSIVGPNNGNDVALRPLSFTKNYPAISSAQNSIEIKKAEFLLAPLGGKDAAGNTVKKGATLIFDGVFGGVQAHIYASIGLATPQFTADASVGSFAVGPVTFDSGSLHISVDPTRPEASFMLAGGFTDKVTNIRFSGKIELGASAQLANAAIALHIAGGQPSYLVAQADLTGQVSFSPTTGLTFGASGSVRMYVANTVDLGNVSFSYSSSSGALWQQLSQAPNVVANTFKQIYGWSDVKIAQELKSLRFTANDVAKGIGQGLNETNTQVTAAMYKAGYTADQTVQAVKTWGNATLGDIATGLNQAGAKTDEIVAATKNAFGNSAATAYNTLQAIGQGGQSAVDSVANFFNPGSYYISNKEHWYDFPMFFDVYNSSQAPDTHVIQWTLNNGYNQQWYVLPTDSGYAEIVNRNSGQCLSVYGNSAGPAPLVQYPCFGGANQQWLFSGGTSNLGGSTGTLQSRSSKLMADVAGESATAGAWIDQWYANGHNNQLFTFTKAFG